MTGAMNDNRAMPARLSAFVIWAFAASGLVFWGYRLSVRPLAMPAHTRTVSESAGARGDMSRMLGTSLAPANVAAAPVAANSRFRLLGVLAPPPGSVEQHPARGVALIAVDGKPARAYKVGARLDNELVLQSISRRSASIGPAQGAASVVLELPPPLAPATGTLPKPAADGGAAQPSAPVPLRPMPPVQPQSLPQPQPQPQQQPPQQQLQPQALSADAAADEDASVSPARRRSGGNAASR
jgi:general secretion pathway protein C